MESLRTVGKRWRASGTVEKRWRASGTVGKRYLLERHSKKK